MPTVNNTIHFPLPSMLTAEAADMLAESLRQFPLVSKPNVCVDASDVETISACGAQLLVSLHKAVLAMEGEFTITHPKPLFTAALQSMGMDWLLKPAQA